MLLLCSETPVRPSYYADKCYILRQETNLVSWDLLEKEVLGAYYILL